MGVSIERLLQKELQEMEAEQVCINFIGDLSPLPRSLQHEMHRSIERTKNNRGIYFNVAIIVIPNNFRTISQCHREKYLEQNKYVFF